MRGTSPSSATVRRSASSIGASASSGRSCATRSARSAASRIGRANTGPRPGTMSTSTPASFSGTTMSLKKMAASTPCRRTGCTVISAASSGVRQASSIAVPARDARYSGRERPACRMNHTGGITCRSPAYARSSGAGAGVGSVGTERHPPIRRPGDRTESRDGRPTLLCVLRALTADYRVAGFDLLERLSVVSPESMARFAAESPGVEGVVLLATCNRFEAYLDVTLDDDSAVQALVQAAAAAAQVQPDALRAVLTERAGIETADHLFAVSSGLESLVVGEAEIAGQVSRALESARRCGSTTSELERLFQRASRTSSTVQNRTRVGFAGRSIVRLALDLAESRQGDWARTTGLLIGTGTYAGATLAALRDRGVTEVGVYSPSGRAERFARREGVSAVATADL